MKYLGRGSLILFMLTLGLVSCSHIAPQAPPSQLSWQDREIILKRIQNWQVNGKIGVQTAQDSGSATVDWIQNQQRYTVSLLGPLGAGGMTLTGSPTQVTLEMSDGKKYTANDAESLLAKRWGFHLPISYLNYWIRGLPVPSIPANSHYDDSHRLSLLTQQGWQVQFLSYTHQNNVDLPSKLYITSALLKAKIIIYSWNLSH